jgi:hypothetical protein
MAVGWRAGQNVNRCRHAMADRRVGFKALPDRRFPDGRFTGSGASDEDRPHPPHAKGGTRFDVCHDKQWSPVFNIVTGSDIRFPPMAARTNRQRFSSDGSMSPFQSDVCESRKIPVPD